jgi:heme/copper-type cytochrome/quinol oxidase subunit 4
MANNLAKEIHTRVKGYVRGNWGAPFVVGFMLLLMIAAASLSMGLATLADEVAVCAFFALVVGVILQLVCYLKYTKGNGEKGIEQT